MNSKLKPTLTILLILVFSGMFLSCSVPEAMEESVQIAEDAESADAESVEVAIPTNDGRDAAAVPLAMPATPSALDADPEVPPTIKESRRLVLEWPPTIRKGDSDLIRITLEMDDDGDITPTVEIEGHESSGRNITVPDLYDSHIVTVKPQLNLSGINFSPSQQVTKTLRRGESVSFYWSVNPDTEGEFLGTASLQLNFKPIAGGDTTSISLSDQIFKIQVKTLFGMSGQTVRIVGWAFSLLGAIFSLDDIIKAAKRLFASQDKKDKDSS